MVLPSSISDSFARSASKSTGSRCAPGRSVIGTSPFSTLAWIAWGQPPGGWPRLPRIMSTTESGKDMSRSGFVTSSGVRFWDTIISAMSPTTLDDGVTLTMSPNMRFTSA